MFEIISKNLEKLGYKVSCFGSSCDAVKYLETEMSGQTIGFGGSKTLEKVGLYEALSKNNTVYWHWKLKEGETVKELRDKAVSCDVYFSSVNAIAETGEIINIDGACNRVASIFYGHKKVYLVIGANKIEKDYDSALYRARNTAAPLNAQRFGLSTPCAKNADKCYNCSSPERICRGLSVLWAKPMAAEYEVILINEELGY